MTIAKRSKETPIENTPLFANLINWMTTRLGKVTYSMKDRLGPNSYDCSSAIYFALIEGKFLPYGTMGDTDSLFRDLENNCWEQLDGNNASYKEGDIFIWGTRGNSGGVVGHCGVFINETEIIHCNYTNNGISINNYSSYWKENGAPRMTVYRSTREISHFTDQSFELKFVSGVFTPNTKLPVCSEPTEESPALAYYEAGMQIYYDSYTIFDRFVWISYIAGSGNRRYVAVGPDDNNPETVWGTGFEKPNDNMEGKDTPYTVTSPRYVDGVMIVNKKNPVPYNYTPYENEEAGNHVRILINDMQNLGFNISNSYSGFRSFDTQARLYQNYVNSYGKAEADTFSARAGYSEHQTGLAYDLLHSDGSLVEHNDEVNWIALNAHKYGFIVRYKAGKEHITGYQAEPWHLRYVGSIATEIYDSGLTLEEYLGVEGGNY